MTLLAVVVVAESLALFVLLALWHWRVRKVTNVLGLLLDFQADRDRMRCETCSHQRTAPVIFRRHPPMTDPTCGLASRGPEDDTPNDDDGEPIVVRCVTLGGGCWAWARRPDA